MMKEATSAEYAQGYAAGFEDACKKPQVEPEPVAWAMKRPDGLVLDVICPDERESYQGEYTVPLYLHPAAPAPAVPTGWVLVPVEPTVEMRRAAAKWITHYHLMRPVDKTNAIDDAYRAMIATAPPPDGDIANAPVPAVLPNTIQVNAGELIAYEQMRKIEWDRGYEAGKAVAPVALTPLTDERINTLRQQYGITSNGRGIKEFTQVRDFARAALAAGIKGATP